MRAYQFCTISIVFATLLFSCKKQTESLQVINVADYALKQPGKYITYRTDSTVFTNFGSREEKRYFQEKHIVDAEYQDALGRTAYRIFRFIRDSAGLTPWKPAGSYVITPSNETVEVTEDNLRIIKLTFPLREGFTWTGNKYLPDEPYNSVYDFSNDDDMQKWVFKYEGVNEQLALRGQLIDSVVTITQIKDSLIPVAGSNYGFMNVSEEKYAKHIGMVYQELIMWEYQVVPSPNRRGFGIKRIMIDHN